MRAGGRTLARRGRDPEARLSLAAQHEVVGTWRPAAFAASFAVASALCACQLTSDDRPAALVSKEHAIIGGTETDDYPAVVLVRVADGSVCTGALISTRVVMTAAHCLAAAIRNRLDGGTVGFGGDDDALVATRAIDAMFVHRRFVEGAPGQLGLGFDIGFVKLSEPAPLEVSGLPWQVRKLEPSIVGTRLRAVGYGSVSAVTQNGVGRKRTVEIEVTDLTPDYIVMGNPTENTCQGDSGGPILRERNGRPEIVGINSFGELGCRGSGQKTRIDRHLDLIDEILAAWDGPCPTDGVCDAEVACGAYPDPDCAPCGFNGTCADACPAIDLDCPVIGVVGDACAHGLQCESRICDTGDGVCAEACSLDTVQCDKGYQCVRLDDGVRVCRPVDGCSIVAAPMRPTAPLGFLIVLLPGWLAVRNRRRRSANPAQSPRRRGEERSC